MRFFSGSDPEEVFSSGSDPDEVFSSGSETGQSQPGSATLVLGQLVPELITLPPDSSRSIPLAFHRFKVNYYPRKKSRALDLIKRR